MAQRANARRNPLALLQGDMTVADHLAAPPIAVPHLFDYVMPYARADDFLVMAEARARVLGVPFARILRSIEQHHAFPDDPMALRGGWVLNPDALSARAGIGPSDVQLVETYDDCPAIRCCSSRGWGLRRE